MSHCIHSTKEYANLLKQGNYIWIAAAIVISLVKILIIHCHYARSIFLLCTPNKWVEWRCATNHQPFISQGPAWSLILKSLQECGTVLPGSGSSSGLHLAFPTIMILTLRSGYKWGFCQLLSIFIPIMHPRTGGITTKWIWGPTEHTVGIA